MTPDQGKYGKCLNGDESEQKIFFVLAPDWTTTALLVILQKKDTRWNLAHPVATAGSDSSSANNTRKITHKMFKAERCVPGCNY